MEGQNKIQVLDKGFVELISHMGDDNLIARAARVSYKNEDDKTPEENKKLIKYLLRNQHTSPFEQVVFCFHLKMPLFVARQFQRHRTARINEVSARYTTIADEFYVPELADINYQSTDNKQGRSQEEVPIKLAEDIRVNLEFAYKKCYAIYEDLVGAGVAKEVARIVLPVAMYTEFYWQIDLHNLMHFLELRLDAHAQKEIRLYAKALLDIVEPICAMSIEAFKEFIINKNNS